VQNKNILKEITMTEAKLLKTYEIPTYKKVAVIRTLTSNPDKFNKTSLIWKNVDGSTMSMLLNYDEEGKVTKETYYKDGNEVTDENEIKIVKELATTEDVNTVNIYTYQDFVITDAIVYSNEVPVFYTTITIDDVNKLEHLTEVRELDTTFSKPSDYEKVADEIYNRVLNVNEKTLNIINEIYLDKTENRYLVLKEKDEKKLKPILQKYDFPRNTSNALINVFHNNGDLIVTILQNHNGYILTKKKDDTDAVFAEATTDEVHVINGRERFNMLFAANLKTYRGRTNNKGGFLLIEIVSPYRNIRIFKGAFILGKLTTSFNKKILKDVTNKKVDFNIEETDPMEIVYKNIKEILL
jgi:hypothetical protein